MSQGSMKHSILLYDRARLGESLQSYSVDYIETENQRIKSIWYHSEFDYDVFIWLDTSGNIIKQQVNLCGEVLEWNILSGVRTGVLLEKENEFSHENYSEEVIFDKDLNTSSKQSVIGTITFSVNIPEEYRERLLRNIAENPTVDNMSSKEFYGNFGNPKNFRSLGKKTNLLSRCIQFLRYQIYLLFYK